MGSPTQTQGPSADVDVGQILLAPSQGDNSEAEHRATHVSHQTRCQRCHLELVPQLWNDADLPQPGRAEHADAKLELLTLQALFLRDGHLEVELVWARATTQHDDQRHQARCGDDHQPRPGDDQPEGNPEHAGGSQS